MEGLAGLDMSVLLSAGAVLAALQVLLRYRRTDHALVALRRENERLQDRLFALAESEERYRSLIEAQGDVIVRQASTGEIVYGNEAFARLIGVSPAEIATPDLLAGRQLVVAERGEPRVRDDGSRLVEEQIDGPAGKSWMAWVETAIVRPDGAREWLRVGRDVTEQVESARELEEARRRAESGNEAKSQFLAMVSHEIRTPLNGILGMASLLKDTSLTPEQMTYANAVTSSGEALLSLIDEILDFSRIEAGKLDLASTEFDLHQLVEGVVELLAPRAQGKGIEVAASIGLGVPQRVVGDRDRLRQVLVNLAGNAVKFTEKGGVGITLKRGIAGRIVVEVADTGPGIPEDKLETIFQQFERVDGSPASAAEGTGLGLSISQRIVARMEGDITVSSRLGEGSVFTVSVPLPDADRNQPATRRPNLAHLKALIVSRSPFEAPFILTRLDEAGARAERVASVAAAERRLATDSYDVLIVDRAMGDTAARRLAAAARTLGVGRTIVLLSPFERRGFGSPHAAGFDGYLVKPIRPRSLYERVVPPVESDQQQEESAGRLKSPRGRFRVLVAEDNDINALLVTRVIEKLGSAVERVSNGTDAVEKLAGRARDRFDCALLDIRMPGLDGLAAARAIRADEARRGLSPMHLVALTANVSDADRSAAIEAGFDMFLSKPVDPATLANLLDCLPDRKEKIAAAR